MARYRIIHINDNRPYAVIDTQWCDSIVSQHTSIMAALESRDILNAEIDDIEKGR